MPRGPRPQPVDGEDPVHFQGRVERWGWPSLYLRELPYAPARQPDRPKTAEERAADDARLQAAIHGTSIGGERGMVDRETVGYKPPDDADLVDGLVSNYD